MRINRQSMLMCIISMLLLSSCRAKQNGYIAGTIKPGASAVITAIQNGKDILTIPVKAQDGTFKFELAPGIYTIAFSEPVAHYPLHLDDITVVTGETTVLPPVSLMIPAGSSHLSGKVMPPRPGIDVKLISEGKERASIHTDDRGIYEFSELPSGTYTIQTKAPGLTADSAQVVITDGRNAEQNTVLFPVVSLEGVDWAEGKIRAVGIGMPSSISANKSVQKEMTKRAALIDAQRNMLRIIEQIRIDADHNVKYSMNYNTVASRIMGFLKGYHVVQEHELDGGKIEVVIELPLTGPAGLSKHIYLME